MSDASARAVCSGCGKTYAVPDPSRTYTCKACGGSVAVAMDARDAATEGEERRAVAAELQGALNVVVWLRRGLASGAIVYGLITIALLVVLSKGLLPQQAVIANLVATAAMTCLHVVGFRQVRMQPFLWTFLLAVMATLSGVQQLVTEHRVTLALVLHLSWAAALWSSLPTTRRVRRWLAEHPDLYAAHRLHGTDRRRHGGPTDPARALQQFAKARRRMALGSAAWAGAIAVAVGVLAWRAAAGAPSLYLEPRLAAFEKVWGRADAEAMAELAPADEVEHLRALIDLALLENGWGASWPALGERVLQRDPSAVTVVWPLETDEVGTSWSLGAEGWQLDVLVLPLPSLNEALGRVADAWSARDLPGIAALFEPDRREKAATSLARALERRAWGESWPELQAVELGQVRLAGTKAVFHVPGDELVTRWEHSGEHGWVLTSLNPPD